MMDDVLDGILEHNRIIPIIDDLLLIKKDDGIMLDFGCGKNKREGFCGVDIFDNEKIDIVLGKDWTVLPLDDNAVSCIRAIHSIEHISDPINLWNEFYRICIDKALIYIVVPYPFTPYYFQDPTHKSYYTEKTFLKYFDGEYVNSYSDYGFNGKIIPKAVFIYGLDYMHLSIHALMEVIK